MHGSIEGSRVRQTTYETVTHGGYRLGKVLSLNATNVYGGKGKGKVHPRTGQEGPEGE
jgi:hypothetical protein